MRYLLHARGMGRSLTDVKRIFGDISVRAVPFSEAFEHHMGIELGVFETEYFQRMDAFLASGQKAAGE